MKVTLLESQKIGKGEVFPTNSPERVVQLTVEGEGLVAATALVEVSNDKKKWFTICQPLTVTGDGATFPGDSWPPMTVSWAYMRAEITDISGIKAQATITMGMAG